MGNLSLHRILLASLCEDEEGSTTLVWGLTGKGSSTRKHGVNYVC